MNMMMQMTRPGLGQTLPRVTRKAALGVSAVLLAVSCTSLPQYLRARRSAQWPTAKGVVKISRLQVGYFKGMKGYYGDVQYQYSVGNAEYHGTRLSFVRTHLAVEDAWQRKIDGYPVGKTVTVYYDPADPGFAVLEPGLVGELSLLFKLNIFFVVLFGASFWFVFTNYHDPEARYPVS
jgi:hypothetical protein